MRVVKEAEERRKEILDAAQALFVTKGYDKTTIVDILKEVGIAKGTFYYHFKSKEEVMDSIIFRIVENDVANAKKIASNPNINPIDKIYEILISQRPEKENVKGKMIEQFHNPENSQMHQRSLVLAIQKMSPILADVVKEGIEQNVFSTEYPNEVMEIILVSGQFIFDEGLFDWEPEEKQRKIKAFIYTMEKLLGAQKGSFDYMAGILSKKE